MNKTLLLIVAFTMLIISGCSSNDNRTFGSGITPTPLANVSAKLVNPLLNSPIANAQVKATYSDGQVVKALTDANGYFNIDIETIPGQVNIEISKLKYLIEPFIVTVNYDGTLSYNDTINGAILLNASGVAYEIETVSGIEFISGKDIIRSVLSPDEKYLYAIDINNKCIYRINLQDKTYKAIDLYNSPVSIAVTKDGGTIYIGYREAPVSKITNIDGAPNEISIAEVNGVYGMALTKDEDTLYVCNPNIYGIKKITGLLTAQDVSGVQITTIAGSDSDKPLDICLSPDENSLYIASVYSTISRINGIKSAAPEVAILAGTSGASGYLDGDGDSARFNRPNGIFTNDAQILFVVDTDNLRIRKIEHVDGVQSVVSVTTIAGTGTSGKADGDGLTEAKFIFPSHITINVDGTIAYITDSENNIRRMVAKEK